MRGLLHAVASLLAVGVPSASAAESVWRAPTGFSAAGQIAQEPQVAMAPDATTTAIWTRNNGTHYVVQAAVRAPGAAAFGPAADLSASDEHAYSPQVAMASDGTTAAVWQGLTNVQAAVRIAGAAAFGVPVDLSMGGGVAREPQVAVAPGGATSVVWVHDDGTHSIVQAAVRAPGAPAFGPAIGVSATGHDSLSPQIAVAPDGTATALWLRRDETGDVVQGAVRARGAAAFGVPFDISEPGQLAFGPRVAVAVDGTATAVWYRSDGTSTVVQAAVRRPGDAAFGAPMDLSAPGHDAANPEVAITPDGTTTVVWSRPDGTNNVVQAAVRAPGEAAFGAPLDLSAPGHDAANPEIAAASDGTAIAVWQYDTGTSIIVQAAVRTPGAASFGAATDLSTSGDYASTPEVASAGGRAMSALWTTSSGQHYAVQGSWITASPTSQAVPAVSGLATVGGTLSCDPGRWIDAATVEISWLAGAQTVGSGLTLALTQREAETAIACQVTATNPYGTATASSAPVAVAGVTGAAASIPVEPSARALAIAPARPSFLALPRVRGLARVGRTLTCGGVVAADATSVTRIWLRDGRAIRRAPAATYGVTARDRGRLLACRVTLVGPGGRRSATAPARRVPPPPRQATALRNLVSRVGSSMTLLGERDQANQGAVSWDDREYFRDRGPWVVPVIGTPGA